MKVEAFLLSVLLLLLLMSGCAPGPNGMKGTPTGGDKVAGFWQGLWQGFIAPFVFLVSLFKPDLNIYEIHNNGPWYNFGYIFGFMALCGGGKGARRSSRRHCATQAGIT